MAVFVLFCLTSICIFVNVLIFYSSGYNEFLFCSLFARYDCFELLAKCTALTLLLGVKITQRYIYVLQVAEGQG
jgi:hypothetical protein